jgi:hypothetical protein
VIQNEKASCEQEHGAGESANRKDQLLIRMGLGVRHIFTPRLK